MNALMRVVTLATLAFILGACASRAPAVQLLQYPGADLTSYATFSFLEPLSTDQAGYEGFVSQQLKTSTRRELEARGYRHVDDGAEADLLVNFYAHLDRQLVVREIQDPWVGVRYWDFRSGIYDPWPAYSARTEVASRSEGTLTVDLVDAGSRQLIWEGMARNRLEEREIRNLQPVLDAAVTEIFRTFPSR